MDKQNQDPPFRGGSQRVPENPPEVPGGGRTVMQTVVVIVGLLVVLAGVLYLVGRMGS